VYSECILRAREEVKTKRRPESMSEPLNG